MADHPEDLRMNAYYFGFHPTGERSIDVVLSAVACAGKAYHHTDGWLDDCEPYESAHRGSSCAEWIQYAAVDAASELRKLRAELESLRAERDLYRQRAIDDDDALEPWYGWNRRTSQGGQPS